MSFDGYDIIVAGAGHAGCEASLAAARMGCRVLLITMDLGKIAQMSCNPAIGGLAKGHLVKELDALGGEMGKATDIAGIQFRTLNLSKGPAVWSSRAQADRIGYREYMTAVVQNQANLELMEDTVVGVEARNGRLTGVRTGSGKTIECRAAIVTGGTFLNGLIHIGDRKIKAGRIGEKPAVGLTEQLQRLGFVSGRLKTGTPPRLDGNTIDFDQLEIQHGHEDFPPFSLRTTTDLNNNAVCWVTYTNGTTHDTIRANINKSAMFSGQIRGVGPRYCPSIEDKIVRFADKERHQLFLEPEGNGTTEIYPNGFSTSLPEDVQLAAMRTVPGLEDVAFTVPGYAVEYDFFFPYQIKPTTETKLIDGLYFSGQINGTSGYEEAATQGYMSGVNAALRVRGEQEFTLDRSEAYIGVLLDDLATKSTEEPYRMFTSRAEYRLHLREDNAVERLIGFGHRFGLIPDDLYKRETDRVALVRRESERLEKVMVPSSALPVEAKVKNRDAVSIAQALKMPDIRIEHISRFDESLDSHSDKVKADIAIAMKYEGYIEKQKREIAKFKRLEKTPIPSEFPFENVRGIRREATEKLSKIRPVSVGQASRISGISPGDISVLMVHLKRFVT